jgi:hypothetical protein
LSATEADVARCLLGTWPSQVARWGEEGIAAYLAELAARKVSCEQALLALRCYDPTADFPPSAATVAQQARRDPSLPTGEEAVVLVRWALGARAPTTKTVWADGERQNADRRAMLERASECHPWLAAFITRYLPRLAALDLADDAAPWDRRTLIEMWRAFVEKAQERDLAALLRGGSRGELGRFDPLAVLTAGAPRELKAGARPAEPPANGAEQRMAAA